MSVYDGDDLSKLDDMLGDMLKKFPEERKKLVSKAGDLMEQKVKENLGQHKNTGETLSAVKRVDGSGGGYVAIRNDYEKCRTTHLLENGHEIKTEKKSKTKKKKTYKPKSNKNYQKIKEMGGSFVPGRHCYRNALLTTQDEIIAESEKMAKKLVGDTFG